MKKKKELAYSRALVPVKRKIYKIISILATITILLIAICLVACNKI